jgi:hypothetical protein
MSGCFQVNEDLSGARLDGSGQAPGGTVFEKAVFSIPITEVFDAEHKSTPSGQDHAHSDIETDVRNVEDGEEKK